MIKWFNGKRRSMLGIDINPTSVNILQISQTDNSYCIEAYARALLPKQAMEGYVIKDVDAIASAIRELIHAHSICCKDAVLAVPDSFTISKVIHVNGNLRRHEMEEAVAVAAIQCLPHQQDEINTDFNILGPSPKNPAMLDVFMVVTRRPNISQRVDVMNRSGLKPRVIEVESSAVQRAASTLLNPSRTDPDNSIIAIVNVGVVHTHFYVLRAAKIIFSREEAIGSRQLTDSLVQHYGFALQEVILKIAQAKLPRDFFHERIHSFHELLLQNIKRAIQLFLSTHHESNMPSLFLAGDLVMPFGLDEFLQTSLRIPTRMVDLFSHMSVAKHVSRDILIQDAPMLLVACGLALRGSDA